MGRAVNLEANSPDLRAFMEERSLPSGVIGPLDLAPFSRAMRARSSGVMGMGFSFVFVFVKKKRPSGFGGGPRCAHSARHCPNSSRFVFKSGSAEFSKSL